MAKISPYVPNDLMDKLAVWEERNGKLNLSALVQETIRRAIGELNAEDRAADNQAALHATVKRQGAALAALQKRVKALEAR